MRETAIVFTARCDVIMGAAGSLEVA